MSERTERLAQNNFWEMILDLRDEQREARKNGIQVIKEAQLPLEVNRQGLMRWYMHPEIKDTILSTYLVFSQEIPPGSRSGRLRFGGDQVIYVIEGEGYTLLDGVKHPWKAGDCLNLPLRKPGIVVQHFNTDPEKTAKFIAVEPNFLACASVDRGVGFEQLENAPEFDRAESAADRRAAMHVHTGIPHIHATVDNLAVAASPGSRQRVQLDPELMAQLRLSAGDAVRVATERGRSTVARLETWAAGDGHVGTVRMDRFLRQALKARLNETVEIEAAELVPAKRVELLPSVDVSTAHGLIPHLTAVLAADRTPVSRDAVLYLPFPGTTSGTTYLVTSVDEGPSYVTADTEISLQYADAHVPDGAMDVTFEDVGGLGAQIRAVRELVQLPLKFPHVYQQLGITAPRGIILYGPPGAGKTRMARAIANEVEARFYYINGPDIIGTYAGETEGNLRRIFGEAGHHAPSIIFIDELDAIAPKRGETGAHADIRVVTQLLSLMDGLTRVDSVVVVATTNRLEAVDPAFRRPGRFDREIFVGPPDAAGRRDVLDIHTREMPLTEDALAALDDIAYRTHGFVGADLMELCREAGLSALRRNTSMLADYRAAFRIQSEQLQVSRADFEHALGLVRPSALRETLISRPDVTWADVAGLDSLRAELRELVEMPLHRPQVLAAMGLSAHSGVLLYGPSGTGKTLLAQAVANECGVNFIAISGPELFTKWLGESEEAVRHIFRIARQVAPAVIFFDQLDAITPVRGAHSGSMTTERVVNQLLAELDGVEPLAGIVVLGATNRIDLVDPAILRPGRLGTHVHVPLPDESGRRAILQLFLAGQDVASSIDALLPRTKGFSGAQLRELCARAKRLALRRTGYAGAVSMTTGDLLEAVDTVTTPTSEVPAR